MTSKLGDAGINVDVGSVATDTGLVFVVDEPARPHPRPDHARLRVGAKLLPSPSACRCCFAAVLADLQRPLVSKGNELS